MGNFKGFMWFVCCTTMAIGLWAVNVAFVDNAIPSIMTSIETNLTNSLCNMDGWAQLFITLERYAPLFLVFVGLLGWILEIYVFGRNDVGIYG